MSASRTDVRMETIDALPSQHRRKFAKLQEDYFSHNTGLVRVAPDGRLVIHNTAIPGSKFTDVIRALYVAPRGNVNSSTGVTGLPQMLAALHEMNVPASLISSKVARAQYMLSKKQQGGSGHEKVPCFPGQPMKFLRLY